MAEFPRTPGVHALDAETYHADKGAASASGMVTLSTKCPAKLRHELDHPKPQTPAQFEGEVIHMRLLEPERFAATYGRLPEDYNGSTKAGKAAKAEVEAAGLMPLKDDLWTMVEGIAEAIQAHPFAWAALKGKPERSLYWRDEETGLWCRCRPDALPSKPVLFGDLKSCLSAHPDDIRRDMWKWSYFQKAAFYADGIKALDLAENPTMVLPFVEKEPPHIITVAVLKPAALEWGRIRNRKALHTFAKCLRTGEWPAYAEDVVEIDLPPWAERDLQEKSDQGLYEIAADMQAPLDEPGEAA